MSIEQVKAFMAEVKANSSLQDTLGALPKDDAENAMSQCIKIASDAGFKFSKEDLLTFNAQSPKEDTLSDSELEQVSGGAFMCHTDIPWCW